MVAKTKEEIAADFAKEERKKAQEERDRARRQGGNNRHNNHNRNGGGRNRQGDSRGKKTKANSVYEIQRLLTSANACWCLPARSNLPSSLYSSMAAEYTSYAASTLPPIFPYTSAA